MSVTVNESQTETPNAVIPGDAQNAPQVADPSAPGAQAQDAPKETASALLSKLARQKKEQLGLSKKLSERDAEKARLEARLKELEEKTSQKPKTPIEALQAAGYSYEDATNYILNNNQMTPDQKLQALAQEVQSFKKDILTKDEQSQKDAAERAKQEQAQRISEFKDEISDFVTENQTKYELTALYQGQELIYQTIAVGFQEATKEWEENGKQGRPPKIMSVEEAAGLVEAYYEEELEKAEQLEKIKKKRQAPAQTAEPAKPGTNPSPKTLSTAATTSSAPAGRINDPIARAMAALEKMGK